MADIPFVRLRHGMPTRLLQGEESYTETVALMQEVLAAPEMVIDHNTCSLLCNGKAVRLQPLTFAFAWLARRSVKMGSNAAAISAGQFDNTCVEAIALEYQAITPHLVAKSIFPEALKPAKGWPDS